MLEDLDVLVVLSHHDSTLNEARRMLEEMPAKLAALDRRLGDLQKAVAAAHAGLDASKVARRAREREVQDQEAEARRLEGQLTQIKTNEAYKAMLHEIEHAKLKRSALETDILELMDREERQMEELKAREAALKADSEILHGQRRTLEAEGQARQVRVAELVGARAGELAKLSAVVRARYERAYASKAGHAVALVAKASCGGCHTNLPPQVLSDVRRLDSILVCEECGRLLVWEGA